MSYQDRQTRTAESLRVLRETVEAGQRLGFWTVDKVQVCEDIADAYRFVEVLTPEGLRFSLSGGSWNKEGQISCKVACVQDAVSDLRVVPSDALPYGTQVVSASANIARGGEAIAKDMNRRVCGSAEGRAQAEKVRDLLAKQVEARGRLLAHVEKMEALGFSFAGPRGMSASSFYSAQGYKVGFGAATVHETGHVSFETSAASVELFAAVLELVSRKA